MKANVQEVRAASAEDSPRMARVRVNLSAYSAADLDRGAGWIKEGLWLLVSWALFRFCPLPLSRVKCWVLRRFGAQVGRGVVIKPDVRIMFPWRLSLGDHVWLGEGCWLMNLAAIEIQNNVCLSQRAFLCTGNHDYRSVSFDLITEPICIAAGAWVAANAFVGPGVTVGSHAVLCAGSVATRDLEPGGVYRGNPAQRVRDRWPSSEANAHAAQGCGV